MPIWLYLDEAVVVVGDLSKKTSFPFEIPYLLCCNHLRNNNSIPQMSNRRAYSTHPFIEIVGALLDAWPT